MSIWNSHHANCLDWLLDQPANQFHAVCTDPPYGLVEFTEQEVKKLRAGKGGIWRLPPKFDGKERNPLPRFTVLNAAERTAIGKFFEKWGRVLLPVLMPGAHVIVAGNASLQSHVQQGMIEAGYEVRGALIRSYHGFRGGDRPKNAETEFPEVCVTPRGNYEPWMLFRKPISEKTVAQNLRKWGTGGLRMLEGGRPLPDLIPSAKTPRLEKEIADHPSLKPQHFLRIITRALLPMGEGLVLDPFMGSGSTIAACKATGANAVGVELDEVYFRLAQEAIPQLAKLYPEFRGENLAMTETSDGFAEELQSQLMLLEEPVAYKTGRTNGRKRGAKRKAGMK